jgi:hypothetical protein
MKLQKTVTVLQIGGAVTQAVVVFLLLPFLKRDNDKPECNQESTTPSVSCCVTKIIGYKPSKEVEHDSMKRQMTNSNDKNIG